MRLPIKVSFCLYGLLFVLGLSCTPKEPLSASVTSTMVRKDNALEYHLVKNPSALYLLVPPQGYDPMKRYHLWVSLHGIRGTAEDGLSEWYHFAQNNNAFLLSPRGSTPYQPKETKAKKIKSDEPELKVGEWNYDKDPAEIALMVEDVCQRYNIDREHISLLGTSAGSEMGLKLLAQSPRQFWFLSVFGIDWSPQGQDPESLNNLRLAAKRVTLFYRRSQDDKTFDPKAFDATVANFRSLGFSVNPASVKGIGHDARYFRSEMLRFQHQLLRETPKTAWKLPLAGAWRVRFFTKLKPLSNDEHHPKPFQVDPGPSAQAEAALQPEFDDSSWQLGDFPGDWDEWSGDWKKWDGEVILRKAIDIPSEYAGHDLMLYLGQVDDWDRTYFNGNLVGQADKDTPYFWSYFRIYPVPGKLVKAGKNVISIRDFDMFGGGGIAYCLPEDMQVTLAPDRVSP